MATLRKWFGVPAPGANGTDMWELKPDLWTRNFVNARVFLNLSPNSTYVVPLSDSLDENGNPITSITLAPDDGSFVFRQSSQVTAIASFTSTWRQLPRAVAGDVWMPNAIHCDAIGSSLGLGLSDSAQNLLLNSEDLTAWPKDGSTFVATATERFYGITMNDVSVSSSAQEPSIRGMITYSGAASKYFSLLFYAQQLNENTQALRVVIDGFPATNRVFQLRYGRYPQLVRFMIQLPATLSDSFNFGVTSYSLPGTTDRRFRVGAFRALITANPIDDQYLGEYIRTTTTSLRRESGVGIGVPLTIREFAGYEDPATASRIVDIRYGTKLAGLASISGSTTSRPVLAVADRGYQFFDTAIGKPIWWNGSSWVTADGVTA
jgi:hypothetical protein